MECSRQSPYTRQSGDHSCVAKIGFTYLNIIKTENRRKSLTDFFEIKRLCLFLATLFLPNFHSLFTFQERKVKTFPHQHLSTGVKDRIDSVENSMPIWQWTTTRSTLPAYLALLVSQVWEWETIVFSELKGMGQWPLSRGIPAPRMFLPNPALSCLRVLHRIPLLSTALTPHHSILSAQSCYGHSSLWMFNLECSV